MISLQGIARPNSNLNCKMTISRGEKNYIKITKREYITTIFTNNWSWIRYVHTTVLRIIQGTWNYIESCIIFAILYLTFVNIHVYAWNLFVKEKRKKLTLWKILIKKVCVCWPLVIVLHFIKTCNVTHIQ